ncbi:MAG: sugar phosphate isomerase/epimerase family protein, partial [Phocaeicola sp.]
HYYNEIGKRCRQAGLKYGYHNHAHELAQVEERVMLDYMLENTHPEEVFFQMDVYWMVMGQASPVEYFMKYPGRFSALHLKDAKELGQSGMVGFDAILRNLKQAGAQDLIVEVEHYNYDVEKSIEISYNYLQDCFSKVQ